MKKTLFTLFLIAQIGSASADWDDPNVPFNAGDVQKTPMSITWLPVDNVQRVCEAESRKRGNNGFGFSFEACSFWEGNSCTVITKKRPNMHTLGHEMRHCYQGNWH